MNPLYTVEEYATLERYNPNKTCIKCGFGSNYNIAATYEPLYGTPLGMVGDYDRAEEVYSRRGDEG